MQKWDKEIDQATLNNEKEVLEKLKQNYQDALEEINTKIEILMARQDADMQYVIYQVEYQKALKTQVQGILDALQANEFETISEYLAQCYNEGFTASLYSMQSQGVPLILPIDQEQVVQAIQNETMLSESLYNSLGKDIKALNKQIASEISRGISTGMMYGEIARNISGYAGISRNNAMRIARTEGHRIQSKANYDAQVKAESKGADIIKIWSAALDAKTRSEHLKLDGQKKRVGEPFVYGRHKAMYPGEFGVAHLDINCRCRAISKAKWLLDADTTKALGDVSKMTEEQKKIIAKKLGIEPESLGEYSEQIVPVNAKDYADFKRQYNKLWHYEGSELQKEAEERIAGYTNGVERVRSSTQKIKGQETLEKTVKSGTMGARSNTGKKVYYNKNNDYSINIEGISKEVNDSLSEATRNVAVLGTEDGNEHMYLIDLDGILKPYYETNGIKNSVGFDFWQYAEKHPKSRFAFVHNHNTDSSLSQTDLETPIICKNIPIQIAVRNDGVKYIAQRKKLAPEHYYPDTYFSEELKELNEESRSGNITPIERMKKREEIIIESLIKEFYEGVEVVDGRK